MNRALLRVLAALGISGALATWAVWRLDPPEPAVAESIGFDVGRALAHVRELAAEPRPVGSPANRRGRQYIAARLREAGFTVEEQPGVAADSSHPLAKALVNVMGRLPGRVPGGRSVMLVAHVDSVRAGPGAADDAAGVAAILEAARIIAAGPRPRNDLIVLVTDGEEWGMLGAKAFVRRHAWAGDVGAVLNFEARGTGGASVMFETGDASAWLVRELRDAAPWPVASSLSYDVYRLMPNNSDFTLFREAKMEGLNFAFIGEPANYHTAHDNVERLDVRSLAHHGSYALSLARRLGELDLAAPPRDDGGAVWFNVAPPWLVVYPASWTWPLAIAAAGLTLLATGLAVWRGQAGPVGLLWAHGAMILALVLGSLAAGATWWALPEVWGRERVGAMTLGSAAAGLAVAGLIWAWAGRRMRGDELALAAAAWWAGLALAGAAWLPGGAYLATWAVVLPMGVIAARALAGWRGDGFGGWAAGTLSLAPAILLVVPMLHLASVALTPMLFHARAHPAMRLAAGVLAAPAVLLAALSGLAAATRRPPRS